MTRGAMNATAYHFADVLNLVSDCHHSLRNDLPPNIAIVIVAARGPSGIPSGRILAPSADAMNSDQPKTQDKKENVTSGYL